MTMQVQAEQLVAAAEAEIEASDSEPNWRDCCVRWNVELRRHGKRPAVA